MSESFRQTMCLYYLGLLRTPFCENLSHPYLNLMEVSHRSDHRYHFHRFFLIFVNRNIQLSRKPLSGSSFGILSSKLEKPIDLDNSIKYSDKNQRKNEKITT
jgi:hypothetical protein